MSVIIGRAIPDVRDGLKPVHRRILYSAYEQGLLPTAGYRKSAHHRRRRARQVPPPRRRLRLRRDGPSRAGLLDALPAHRRPGQLRLDRRRSARRVPVHRGAPHASSRSSCWPTSTRSASTSSRTSTTALQEPSGPAVARPQPPGQRLRTASPSAWRPTSRRTTSARSSTPRSHLIRTPDAPHRRPDPPRPGPRLPHGRRSSTAARASSRRTARAAGPSSCARRMNVEKTPGRGEREQIVVTEIPYQVNKARVAAQASSELVREKKHRGHLRGARRERPRRHPPRHRAEERRHSAGRHQPALPADGSADELRRHQPRDRRTAAPRSSISRRRSRRSSSTGATSSTRRTRYELRQAEAQREIIEGLGVAVTDVDLVVQTIRESARSRRRAGGPDDAAARGPRGVRPPRRAGPRPRSTPRRSAAPTTLSERQAKAILEMRLSRLTGPRAGEAREGVRRAVRRHRAATARSWPTRSSSTTSS